MLHTDCVVLSIDVDYMDIVLPKSMACLLHFCGAGPMGVELHSNSHGAGAGVCLALVDWLVGTLVEYVITLVGCD